MQRQQVDPDSTLAFYRRALHARRENSALGDGVMSWIDAPDGVLAFSREPGFVCVINYNDHPIELPSGLADADLILSSGDPIDGTLAGCTAVWLERR